jgi:hypothetical protein
MSMILLWQAASSTATAAASSTPPSSAPDIAKGVSGLADFFLQYLTPLVAIGALSMALIELWKKFFDTRTKFQARRWIGWIKGNAGQAGLSTDEGRAGEDAFAQLLALCTGIGQNDARAAARDLLRRGGLPPWFSWTRVPAHSVFGLELERMMGSIQEAADTVMANPHGHENLFRVFTVGAAPNDVSDWLKHGANALLPAATAAAPTDEQRQQIKAQSELSARLRQVIKGKFDGFQLYTSDSWANYNQLFANLVGIVIMLGSLMYNRFVDHHAHGLDGYFRQFRWSMMPLALIGGILSPVAKDLVSALQKVKDG